MKIGVEELKERIVEADKAIAEITASMAELEKQKSKVHHVHLPGNINFHRIVPTKIMQGLFHNFVQEGQTHSSKFKEGVNTNPRGRGNPI